MKKILAAALSLVMCAAFMTGCGDTDSSSSKADKKDSSSSVSSAADTESSSEADQSSSEADTSSEADASSDESSEAPAGEAGPLTQAFAEKLKEGNYAIETKTTIPGMEDLGMNETNMSIKMNGEDFYINVDLFGMAIEVTKLGDKCIAVVPEEKSYTEVSPDELGIDLSQFQSYIPNDKGTFTGSAEEDGFTVESYSVPLDVELGEGVSMTEAPKDTVVKYYYDANGDIKKIVTDTGIMGESTMEITSLTVGGVTIELPDTTGLKLVTKEEMEAAEQAESNESAEESQN